MAFAAISVPKGYVRQRDDGSYAVYNLSAAVYLSNERDEYENGVIYGDWILQHDVSGVWTDIAVSTRSLSPTANTVMRTTVFDDKSILEVTYRIPDDGPLKVSIRLIAGRRDTFRIVLRISGLDNENTNQQMDMQMENTRVTITFPDYLGSKVMSWDWSDVTDTLSVNLRSINGSTTFEQIFPVGLLNRGDNKLYDPNAITSASGIYATAYANSRHIIRDAYGKVIVLHSTSNIKLAWTNNPIVTSPPFFNAFSSDGSTKLYSGSVTRAGGKATLSGYVEEFGLRLTKVGSPSGDVTLTLRNSSDTILYSKVIAASTIAVDTWYFLPIIATLSSDTYRCLVEYSSGDVNNCISCYYLTLNTEVDWTTYQGTYSDNTGLSPTMVISSWANRDTGIAVSSTSGEGVCSIAYDSSNDRAMVVFVDNSSTNAIEAFRLTFTRDGSNNITDYTASSRLTITANKQSRRPSIWMLHNGEVGLVYGDNSTGGSKHGDVHGCRLVFGDPPTYKKFSDGSASGYDVLSSVYSSAHTTHVPTIVERTKSGTGQYDCYALWFATYAGTSEMKNKLTWSSPNWTVGSETAPTTNLNDQPITLAYDATNGYIVYAAGYNGNNTAVTVGDIASDDTDTSITKVGLTSLTRMDYSLCTNNGDFYLYYTRSNYVYYMKYSGGAWGTEIQAETTGNSVNPSASIETSNRIDFVYERTTTLYYEYLSLGGGLSTGSADARSSFSVKNAGTKNLSTSFTVLKPGSADLSSSFTTRLPGSGDLSSNAAIRNLSTRDLSSSSSVRNFGSKAFSSSLTARKTTSSDESSSVSVRNLSTQSLSSSASIRNSSSANESASFTSRKAGLADLSSSITARQSASLDLSSSFRTRAPGSAAASSSITLRKSASQPLSSSFYVRIFHADFETNDFTGWTTVENTTGETHVTTDERAHHDVYSARFASDGSTATEYSRAVKTLPSSKSNLYVRTQILISRLGLDFEQDRFYNIIFMGSEAVAFAGVKFTSSAYYWHVLTRNGTGWTEDYATIAPQLHHWYSMELHWYRHATAGFVELYIDGAKVAEVTGINTNTYGDATSVQCGLAEVQGSVAATVYLDCVDMRTDYVDVEASGYQEEILSASFKARQAGSKGLSSSLRVRNAGSKDLSTSFTIGVIIADAEDLSSSISVRNASSKAISSSLAVRNASSKALSTSTTIRNLGSKSLSASVTIRKADSAALSSSLAARHSASADLSASFTARASATRSISSSITTRQTASVNASSSLSIQNIGSKAVSSSIIIQKASSWALSTSVTILNASAKDSSSSITVRNTGSRAISTSVTIRNLGITDLSASITARNTSSKDLSSSFNVKNASSRDLSSSFTAGQIVASDLSSSVSIKNAGLRQLSSSATLRKTASSDLSSSFHVRFYDGFESGNTNAWDTTSGTFSVVNGGHHGNYMLQTSNTALGNIGRNISANIAYARAYIYLSNTPPSDSTYRSLCVIRVRNATSELANVLFMRNAANTLRVGVYNAHSTITYLVDYAWASARWYYVEIGTVRDAVNGELHLWINGTKIVNQTGIDTGDTDISAIRFGQLDITAGWDVTLNHDCIIVDTVYSGPESSGTQFDYLSSSFTSRKSATNALSSSAAVRNVGTKALSTSVRIRNASTKTLSSSFAARNVSSKDNSSSFTARGASSKDLSSNAAIRNASSKNLSSSITIRSSSSKTLSTSFTARAASSQNLSASIVLRKASSTTFSTSFYVETFFIIQPLSTIPVSVQRVGASEIELRCDWHDEADLPASSYACRLSARSPLDTIYVFGASVTKEGSKEYHATYSWNPPDDADVGFYDLKAEVFR